jgi:hypothetical protein
MEAKDYTSSTVYDYIEVKNDKGFRKKVTPQLDGTFLVDDSSEQLSLTQKEGVYTIHYLTAYAKWDEELVSVSDEQFITRNNSKKSTITKGHNLSIYFPMAKRRNNESSIGDVLKEIIEKNKLQPGIDQVAVKDAWKSLMGNGVNTYTRNVVLKGNTLYVELTSASCARNSAMARIKSLG